jgi:hypothetical protein
VDYQPDESLVPTITLSFEELSIMVSDAYKLGQLSQKNPNHFGRLLAISRNGVDDFLKNDTNYKLALQAVYEFKCLNFGQYILSVVGDEIARKFRHQWVKKAEILNS